MAIRACVCGNESVAVLGGDTPLCKDCLGVWVRTRNRKREHLAQAFVAFSTLFILALIPALLSLYASYCSFVWDVL